jgi:hypothetical protein
MPPNILWERSVNVTSSSTADGFCSQGDGLWRAVQALITFLTTNIIAHAATLYLQPGADTSLTIFSVFQALLLPVNAGDFAFHVIGRYIRRARKGQIKGSYFGGFKFEDAATSGAIAISIPLKFVPLVHGRWDSVSSQQKLVMLDNEKFSHAEKWDEKLPGQLPFTICDNYFRYVPYILPSTTKFPEPTEEVPGYYNHRISPQSSMLQKAVALIQLFLSARSIYNARHAFLQTDGLSSPFLVVVPYLLMTTINLVANMLVGSYTQIVVLPMKQDKLPKPNQVYIGHWEGEECERVITLAPRGASSTSSSMELEKQASVPEVNERGSSTALPPSPTKRTISVNEISAPESPRAGPVRTTSTTPMSSKGKEIVSSETTDQADTPRLIGTMKRSAYFGIFPLVRVRCS